MINFRKRAIASAILCTLVVLFLCSSAHLWAQSDSDLNTTVQSVGSALRVRQYESALQLIEPVLRKFPNDPRLWSMQALALSGLGRGQDALAAYRHALKISPDYLPALEGAAQLEYEGGGKNAAALLQRILALHPDDETSHAMLGALQYKLGDCPGAVLNLGLSGSVIDSQALALRQYGSCLAKLQRLDEAVEVFQKLVTLKPDDASNRTRLAALQLRANHGKDAIATLQPLLQGQPEARVSEVAAAAYEAEGNTQEAARALNRAVAAYPRDIDLYVDLAGLAFDHHSFASGIEVMTSGLRVLPDAAQLYLERGILYVQLADYEKAEADFEKAGRLDPGQSVTEIAQGKIAEQQGDFAKALEKVQQKLVKNPNDPFLLYTRAEILVQKGVEPGSREFRLALDSARKAVELQPHMVLARNILVTLYMSAGQYDAAVEQSRKILDQDPNNESALYHLVIALRRQGNTQELPELLKRLAQLHRAANKSAMARSHDDDTAASPVQ
jgi:tetratricopeptide (TPR) repeat protein